VAERILQVGSEVAIPRIADHAVRAQHHLTHLEEVATPDGRIAELYTAGKANHNLPLGWAQSLYIVAKLSLREAQSRARGR
jgi:hypothetical protein